jgi:serine/threonine protein kinase
MGTVTLAAAGPSEVQAFARSRRGASPRNPPLKQEPHAATTVEKETSEHVSHLQTFNPRLTRTSSRLGTGAYMSPEQFRDPMSVDVRADIYGFGVVLFEMITGGLPFKGESMEDLRHQHCQRKPPSVISSIPPRHAKVAKRIDEVVQRCLRKDPVERFNSVAVLRRALKEILAQLPAG